MPRDEKDSDECRYQLHDSEVVLLVHSGSRGLGGHVLEQFTQSGLNSMHKVCQYMSRMSSSIFILSLNFSRSDCCMLLQDLAAATTIDRLYQTGRSERPEISCSP